MTKQSHNVNDVESYCTCCHDFSCTDRTYIIFDGDGNETWLRKLEVFPLIDKTQLLLSLKLVELFTIQSFTYHERKLVTRICNRQKLLTTYIGGKMSENSFQLTQ